MRISNWSSDVCTSDLTLVIFVGPAAAVAFDCRHDLHVEAMRFFDHALSGEIVFLRTEGEPINFAPKPRQVDLEIDLAGIEWFALPVWIDAKLGLLAVRSEEHTSELQSLMRISYAVFCLKKKTLKITPQYTNIL